MAINVSIQRHNFDSFNIDTKKLKKKTGFWVHLNSNFGPEIPFSLCFFIFAPNQTETNLISIFPQEFSLFFRIPTETKQEQTKKKKKNIATEE